MEAPRRIELVTPAPINKEKKKIDLEPSHRFKLTLQDPTERSCSEFSFVQLMKNAKSKAVVDERDPFAAIDGAENEKLAAMAKELEEKYGKQGGYAEEYIDLGEGYDTNDSFIDNAEAYDELVPSCLTTKLGGFYINSGVLDFRDISEKSQRHPTSLKKKKRKTLMIQSDSGSDKDFKKKKITKKIKLNDADFKAKKRKRSMEEAEKKSKKYKKKKIKDRVIEKEPSCVKVKSVSELVHGNSSLEATHPDVSKEPTAEEIAAIESTIDAVISKSVVPDIGSPEDSQDGTEGIKMPTNPETVPKLPENLGIGLMHHIETVKKAACDSTCPKGKFFTSDINKTLLEIDTLSRQGPTMQRSAIFGHMSAYLPCGKDTLLKRIKKLRQIESDDKLKEPLQALKEAIDAEMPCQIEKHVQESLIFVQQSKQDRASNENEKDKGDNEGVTSQTESDDDTNIEENDKETSKRKPRGPIKKFEWSEKIRNLMCRVVAMKMTSYDLVKYKGQAAEDFIKGFLETEVRPLWPKGWMQTRTLFKESRVAHAKWTSQSMKIKKTFLASRPLTTSTNQVMPALSNHHSSPSQISVKAALMQNTAKVVPTGLTNTQPTNVELQSFSTLLDYAEDKLSASDIEVLETLMSSDPAHDEPNLMPDIQPNARKGSSSGWEAEFNKYALTSVSSVNSSPKSNTLTPGGKKEQTEASRPVPVKVSQALTSSHSIANLLQSGGNKAVERTDQRANQKLVVGHTQEYHRGATQGNRKQTDTFVRQPTGWVGEHSNKHAGIGQSSLLNKHLPSAVGHSSVVNQEIMKNKATHEQALMRTKSFLNYQTGQQRGKILPSVQYPVAKLQTSPTNKYHVDRMSALSNQPDITGLSLGQIQQLMHSSTSLAAGISRPTELPNEDHGWANSYEPYVPTYPQSKYASPNYQSRQKTPPPHGNVTSHPRQSPENKMAEHQQQRALGMTAAAHSSTSRITNIATSPQGHSSHMSSRSPHGY